MNIKELNQVTGDILNFEAKVNHTAKHIEYLNDPQYRWEANMDIKIGSSKYQYRAELKKEEVCAILERKLAEEKDILDKFKKRYEELMNEIPA